MAGKRRLFFCTFSIVLQMSPKNGPREFVQTKLKRSMLGHRREKEVEAEIDLSTPPAIKELEKRLEKKLKKDGKKEDNS